MKKQSTEKDFWKLTAQWIEAARKRYAGHGPDDLTQIFMRGPFAGWSELELAALVGDLDMAQKKFPLWKIKK